MQFLSTLPVRGATFQFVKRLFVTLFISIHAPREGSDPHRLTIEGRASDFYPRSP